MHFKNLAISGLLLLPLLAQANTGCTLMVSYPQGKILKEQGDCQQRVSPCSSFKIALALMGYDAGILVDEHHPLWRYKPGYVVADPSHKQNTDPTLWEKNSVVWYSQQITARLGMTRFQQYVDQFHYGNQDVSGDPGKNNGLSRAWLISSLKISPKEQVIFLQKLLDKNLNVSDKAYHLTEAILPQYKTNEGWSVKGKSGSGWLQKPQGGPDKNHPQGWFVGWAEKGHQKVIFAKLIIDDQPSHQPGGPKARQALLQESFDHIICSGC